VNIHFIIKFFQKKSSNNHQQQQQQDDADLSDSYSRELPAIQAADTSSKFNVSTRSSKSSRSSKQPQLTGSRSKQEIVSEYIQSQNSIDKLHQQHTSSHASLPSSVLNISKSKNNTNNPLMSHSKSSSFSSSSSHSRQSTLNNSNCREQNNKPCFPNNNEVIYLKEKGSQSPLEGKTKNNYIQQIGLKIY
jgi:hypothetical protein